MCGIFGYFSTDGRSLDSETIARMGYQIRHRGPDDSGVFEGTGVAIGNQRLSVIDIAGGHQPFVSDDGMIAVVQNGEIFNYRELAAELRDEGNPCRTASDTEILLRAYELHGIDFCHRLNGMFAFAIWDGRKRKLHIVRDRIGVKPLYWHQSGTQFTFGSEIKAILPALKEVPAPDHVALHHFLSFNYVPAPATIYSGIQHLMPGHRMEVDASGVRHFRWWDLADQVPELGRGEADWCEEFNAILDDAVRLRMRSDVPFGAFLSGGVDSSTIVGLMARHAREPIKTFCIGFEDPRFDESPYAAAAAERFGTSHRVEIVDPDMLAFWPEATRFCDQPHGDISFLPTHRVSALAAREVTVVLTGDGGDELFAGYDKYRSFFSGRAIDAIPDTTFRQEYFDSISLFDSEGKHALYSPAMRSLVTDLQSSDIVHPWFDRVVHQDRLNQALYIDMELLLSGNNLVKPDRMGMAVSLEARTPFLDYRMMEFAFRMPGALKLKDGETKYLYKKAVEPLIGHELAYRKKQMFTVPVGNWFKTHLHEYCRSHIEQLVERSGLFDAHHAQWLLESHRSGTANHTREIRALIALNLWFELHESQAG